MKNRLLPDLLAVLLPYAALGALFHSSPLPLAPVLPYLIILLLLASPVWATVRALQSFQGRSQRRFLALLIVMAWLIPFMGPIIVVIAPELPDDGPGAKLDPS